MKKTILDVIPQHVRSVAGYVPGKPVKQAQRESGMGMIKLASNENPLGPSPLAVEAIRQAADSVNFYPDNDASELRAALAQRHELGPEQVFITDGSNALLDLICRMFLSPGLNCISSERSFISYPIFSKLAGGGYVTLPTKNDGYDLDAIASAINDHTRVVILANPNNPTGTMFDAGETEAFLRRVPDHVLVVLDEAYHEFAAGGHYLDLRNRYEHVVLLRTLSKFVSLAGVRCGLIVGAPELIEFAQVVLPPYTFPTPSIELVQQALSKDSLKISEERVDVLKRERARLS